MTIQAKIELYYRKHTDHIDKLQLCVAKELPKRFNLYENHPGTILWIKVDRAQEKPLFKIGFSNKTLIEFKEFEESDDLTDFLSHVFFFNLDSEEQLNNFYFEVNVQRRFYDNYLLGDPAYMDFMKGSIKRLAVIHETEDELKMIMECKRISVFYKFTHAYNQFCAKKLHFIKNQYELNRYLSSCIITGIDLAEYEFFHQ